MKRILHLLLFLPFALANAQDSDFFRVYNSKGKKINKGYLFDLSDTSISLTRKKTIIEETPVSQINIIKSKRTTGHRVLVTTASIVGFVAVVAIIASSHQHGRAPGLFNTGSGRRKKESIKPLPPPKPFKKYKVGCNTQIWQEQKALLGLVF